MYLVKRKLLLPKHNYSDGTCGNIKADTPTSSIDSDHETRAGYSPAMYVSPCDRKRSFNNGPSTLRKLRSSALRVFRRKSDSIDTHGQCPLLSRSSLPERSDIHDFDNWSPVSVLVNPLRTEILCHEDLSLHTDSQNTKGGGYRGSGPQLKREERDYHLPSNSSNTYNIAKDTAANGSSIGSSSTYIGANNGPSKICSGNSSSCSNTSSSSGSSSSSSSDCNSGSNSSSSDSNSGSNSNSSSSDSNSGSNSSINSSRGNSSHTNTKHTGVRMNSLPSVSGNITTDVIMTARGKKTATTDTTSELSRLLPNDVNVADTCSSGFGNCSRPSPSSTTETPHTSFVKTQIGALNRSSTERARNRTSFASTNSRNTNGSNRSRCNGCIVSSSNGSSSSNSNGSNRSGSSGSSNADGSNTSQGDTISSSYDNTRNESNSIDKPPLPTFDPDCLALTHRKNCLPFDVASRYGRVLPSSTPTKGIYHVDIIKSTTERQRMRGEHTSINCPYEEGSYINEKKVAAASDDGSTDISPDCSKYSSCGASVEERGRKKSIAELQMLIGEGISRYGQKYTPRAKTTANDPNSDNNQNNININNNNNYSNNYNFSNNNDYSDDNNND